MIHYKDVIAEHGGDRTSFFSFDDDDDQLHLLPYATLTSARKTDDLLALIGVYEWQNGPLFMLVDGDTLGGDRDKLSRLRRLVAMRGDAPYLAVIQAGRLTVYGVGLDDNAPEAIDGQLDDVQLLIPHIINKRPGIASKQRWISDVILKLLTDALDALVALKIDNGDAISLVGRALFTRFLADRKLLERKAIAEGEFGEASLFDTHDGVINACKWLDDTFNGDFLPLSEATIRSFPKAAFKTVGNIMRRAEGGQLQLAWSEDWAKLDFAHIPVGVLSQAYEQYLGTHQKGKQRKEGSFYTPRHIADLMVHASFAALRRDGKAHCAKVLDPAAGAGVFLITAFRQLVKERWSHDRKRPDTKVLRQILYGQIRGFDINDSALRFAALGLYLMSIELDQAPKPVEKLKFEKDLRKTVILKLGTDDDPNGSKDLGSLGDEVGKEHDSQYDLVIGNPPWSSGTALPDWRVVTDRVRRIARERMDEPDAVSPLPNEVLDLPFVWRAMEWAKPGAQIAFALHARLLFQRGEGMDRALSSIMRSINVTAVVNGSEVRQSKVWPKVEAPFCLLFAQNVLPHPDSGFRFVSPKLEGPLNQTGGWRIETNRAATVATADLLAQPELLKVLYRGSELDREILNRVVSKGFPTFGEYWKGLHGGTIRQPKCAGNGYKKLLPSSRPNPAEGDQRGYSAEAMYPFPALEHANFQGVLLKPEQCRKFRELGLERLDQRRALSLYFGPMMLIKKSPNVGTPRIKCAVSPDNLTFNETYYGYTAHKQPRAVDLTKYLSLVIGSKLALWHCLMTSGEFGFERDVIEKYVIQEIRLPAFDQLSVVDSERARSLFDDLAQGETAARWQAVDEWVGSLFDLTPDDVQTISDTLNLSLPYEPNEVAARSPPRTDSLSAFTCRLEAELLPWGQRFGRPLVVTQVKAPPLSPWEFVVISLEGSIPAQIKMDEALRLAIQHAADTLSSSEIMYRDARNDYLFVGRLNQARYWSVSQARLVARSIIWEHIDFLSGGAPE